jgi:hypothetical protein
LRYWPGCLPAANYRLANQLNFHLMFSGPQQQGGSVKETVHNVHVVFDPIIDHLRPVRPFHHQYGQFAGIVSIGICM